MRESSAGRVFTEGSMSDVEVKGMFWCVVCWRRIYVLVSTLLLRVQDTDAGNG